MGTRELTLTDIAQWCAVSGADPTNTVGELLAGFHEGTDALSLLSVAGAKSLEDSLHVA